MNRPINPYESVRVRAGDRIIILPPVDHGEAWRGDGSGRPAPEPKK